MCDEVIGGLLLRSAAIFRWNDIISRDTDLLKYHLATCVLLLLVLIRSDTSYEFALKTSLACGKAHSDRSNIRVEKSFFIFPLANECIAYISTSHLTFGKPLRSCSHLLALWDCFGLGTLNPSHETINRKINTV